jgi:hypothetical protein
MKASKFSDAHDGLRSRSSLTACKIFLSNRNKRGQSIIGILREHEAGVKTADVCRKHGISSATFYKWKAKYADSTYLTRFVLQSPLTALTTCAPTSTMETKHLRV